jgi:hypothetical protein
VVTVKGVDPPELGSEKAIEAAKKALDNRRNFRFGNLKLEGEFMDLGLVSSNERIAAVDIALNEIGPEDRCGPNPPGNISGSPYPGRTLYAFVWHSSHFGTLMYMKFCLTGTTGTELLVLHSLHASKPNQS